MLGLYKQCLVIGQFNVQIELLFAHTDLYEDIYKHFC